MIDLFSLSRLDDLVTRSHSAGVTDLAAAALIEHEGRFLLVEAAVRDLEDPPGWELPTGRILPGETVLAGLERILAQHFGFFSIEVTRYLGHNDHHDADGQTTLVLAFAVTAEHPDSICHTAHIGHRWIDNITIADTVTNVDHLLRAYYADATG